MKQLNKLGFIVLVFFLSCHSKKTQDNFETVNEGELVNKSFFFSIPYQSSSGEAAIIEVTINGKLKRFMIDTGSPLVISKSLQEELQLPNLMNSTTEDSNGDTTGLDIVRIAGLSIAELQFKNIPAVVLDFKQIGPGCDSIDGFIGSNLLRLVVIQFNKKERKIYFANAVDSFRSVTGTDASGMSLSYEQSSPVIGLSLNGLILDSALYDSGDPVLYTIAKSKFDDYNKNGSLTKKIVAVGTGLSAQGILEKKSDSLSAFILHLDSLSIGNNALKNVFTEPTYASRSRIGRGLWNEGLVTMDYPNHKFYFTPYLDPLQVRNFANFGFKYKVKNGKLVIAIVWNNTKAFRCGLRQGFEIVQYGNFTPKTVPLCDWTIYLKKEEAQATAISIKYLAENGETRQCILPKSEYAN